MPPLSTMLQTQSLPGFEGVDQPPTHPPIPPVEEGANMNPYLRCPLPPFSTTVDTIRQWNMTGKNPVMRVIPLPTQQGAGGGAVTNITNVTTTASGGGGGAAPTPVSLLPQTAFINVPPLLPGATYQAIMRLSQSFQLLQVGATAALEVRLYADPVTRANDIARMTDLAVQFSNIEGVITDVVLDTYPYQWTWENRIGANADSPQTVNLYVTVVNPSQTTGTNAARVTVVYLPLES